MRVLIVDDSALMRKLIRRDLEKRGGVEIFEAENGRVALNKMLEVKPDILTLDVDMPVMNGYDACSRIRSGDKDVVGDYPKLAETPVVFITANDTLEGRTKGFQAGATDFITKPFMAGEVLAALEKALSKDDDLEGIRVLIVDDDRHARRLLDISLRKEGMEVLVAGNGKEAIKVLEDQPNVDLVITDYMMPGMDGVKLCEAVRNRLGRKELPVIFLTGAQEHEAVLDIFKAGATDYVVKPFSKEELFARINVHLQARLMKSELQQMVIALKRASKLKDEFLAICSHDLRSPLSGILGFSDLLLEKKYMVDEDREFLQHIQDSGQFLLSLINDILDLSRLQSEGEELEFKLVPLFEVMKNCAKTLKHMASPKGIEIILENKAGDYAPFINGDKNSLTRIVNNLLSNAIKFTRKNGKIRLTQELIDEKLIMSVADSGIGIPED